MLFQVQNDVPAQTHELVQVVSPSGQLVYVNQAWRDALGYQASELNGLSFFSILDPLSRERFSQLFDIANDPSLEHNLELTLTAKDGAIVTVEGLVSLIAREGAVVGAHGAFRDVTAKRREDEAREWSEPSYRTLVENARDIISTFDTTGTFLSLNPAFENLTGWSRAEWVGKSFIPLLHADDQEFAREWFGRTLKGIKVPLHEARVRTKAGEYITVESTFKGLYENGKLKAILGVHRDIAERKLAEFLIKESEARFRLLAEACFDGIVIHEDGVIVEANQEFAEMHGYPLAEVIGKPMEHFTENKISKKKDGSRFPVDIRVRTLPHQGRTVRVAAVRKL